MHKLDELLQGHIITVLKSAADNCDYTYLKNHLGLSDDLIDAIRRLSHHSIPKIVRCAPFSITMNQKALLNRMNSAVYTDLKEQEVIKAIQNGASRQCLNEIIDLSDNEYARLKNVSGIGKNKRHKPKMLTEKNIALIATIHSNLVRNMRRSEDHIDSLTLLRKISEASALPFNSIYSYYYPDVKEHFTTFGLSKNEREEIVKHGEETT